MDNSSAGNFDTLFEESMVKIEVNTDDDVDLDIESSSNVQSFQEIKKEEEEGMILDENELLTHSYFIEDTVVKIEYDPEDKSSEFADKTFQCDKCEKSFKNKWHLAKHETVHDEFYYCPVCREKFSSEELLGEHTATPDIHGTLQCDHCPYSTIIKRNNTNHIITHSMAEGFTCDVCEKIFKTKKILSCHMARRHGFYCTACQKKFPNGNLLEEHRATPGIHKTFQCEQCSYSTIVKGNLDSHIRTHSSETFYCEVCKTSFKWQKNLTRHLAKTCGIRR